MHGVMSEALSMLTGMLRFLLKEYVMDGDEPFSYKIVDTIKGETWTEFIVKMVSGTWLTEQEVDETESMIIIGGGSAYDTIAKPSEEWLVKAALKTGSVISHVSNIPYQPVSLISFYHAVITDTKIQEFNWDISSDTIYMQIDPESDYIIRKWEAINKQDRDFRIYVIGES
jgi:hypothetical protein